MSSRRRKLRHRQCLSESLTVLTDLPLSESIQKPPDPAGEVPLQAAHALRSARLALGSLAGQEVAGRRMHAALGHGDAVKGAVELAVAAAVRGAWRVRLPEEAGIGATPARRASLASDAKARRPGGLGEELCGGESPAARQVEQLRAPELRTMAPISRSNSAARLVRSRIARTSSRETRTRDALRERGRGLTGDLDRAKRSRSRQPAGSSKSGQRSCRCQRRRCWSSERDLTRSSR